jgi:trans-2,3-dihydro-3-hydroxyanthranilate isomerase
MKLPYEIWDVFTHKPLQGNPLALLPDASQLSDAQMQAVAREFNLSETSFVLPSARRLRCTVTEKSKVKSLSSS